MVDAVFFDLFGTLLSLAPLDDACEGVAPGRGAELAARWRARQLEASWLRTAMDRWVDFDTVTREALHATLDELGIAAEGDRDAETLADAFAELPLVAGAADGVRHLHDANLVTGILTNASTRTLARVADRLDAEPAFQRGRLRRHNSDISVRRVIGKGTPLRAS